MVHNNRDWVLKKYDFSLQSAVTGRGSAWLTSRGFRKKKAGSNAWPLKRLANQNQIPSATELDPSSCLMGGQGGIKS